MKKGFKNEFVLGRKINVKKSTINEGQIEDIVREIHKEQKEKTSKASVILPKSLYKKMKSRVVELDTTVTDYFTQLLINDLDGNT